MVYTVHLELGKTLSVALLREVKNVADVRKMVMAGSLKCCIVKPCFIVSPFQIAVAANKAVLSESQDKMATKSVYTEILFNLSISKNITQSLMKFGVGDNDEDVFVCVINESAEELDNILSHFQGKACPVEQSCVLSNEKLIRKEYKITESETQVSPLLGSVVSRIAAKDFVTL